jgi:phage shock protein E
MNTMRRVLPVALSIGAAFLFLGSGGPTITGAQARALVKDGAVLVDVRTPQEFAQGHVEGALNLPVAELPSLLARLPAKDRPIVVYCQSGRRSAAARKTLEEAGYSKVSDLGAMSNWR